MAGVVGGCSELLVCTLQAFLCSLQAVGKGLPDRPFGYAALQPVKHRSRRLCVNLMCCYFEQEMPKVPECMLRGQTSWACVHVAGGAIGLLPSAFQAIPAQLEGAGDHPVPLKIAAQQAAYTSMAASATQSARAALVSWVQDFRMRNQGRQPGKADFPPDIGEHKDGAR